MKTTFGRTIAAGTMLALSLSIGPSLASPAEASAGCVTKKEFRNVTKGMGIERVHRIFDTKGRQLFVMSGYQSREYKVCGSQYGFVMVEFKNRKLSSKSAYWG